VAGERESAATAGSGAGRAKRAKRSGSERIEREGDEADEIGRNVRGDGDQEAPQEADADWEESEVDGEGEEEAGVVGGVGGVGKFSKPRSRRKIWQLDDDMRLLLVYAQAVEVSFAMDPANPAALTEGGARKLEKSGAVLRGRVDWKLVAAAVGLKCQQCQRRIKSLSADLPRLRVLYRMTSRSAVETLSANRPALRLEAAEMGAEAISKAVQHVLNNLHLSISTAPIDNIDKSSLPPNLPATVEAIRRLYDADPLFPNRQRRHAWPDASPLQACIVHPDLLFCMLTYADVC
jgi:hypothetical protein